jgi:two-component system, NtrC family, sensor histidine kinase HydH
MAVLGTPAEEGAVTAAARLDTLARLTDDLAHEIKNPLHAAVINLEVLRRRMSRLAGGEDAVRVAEIVGTELDRVSRRVELLLRLSRPDGGQPVRADVVVAEVAELLELVATHRRVAFRSEGVERAREVSRPAGELRMLLLAGALEVMERAGVRAVRMTVQGDSEAPEVVFEATDGGALVGDPVAVDLLDPGRAAGLSS